MEQFVLGIFQEQLSKVIVGFRKEQVNTNLLNGKGEIKDVSLNCAFLNERISQVTPYIELEAVHVSKLSFHVVSWTNIKKAPILVDIEDVEASIVEPLRYIDRSKRKTLRQLTRQEFEEIDSKKKKKSYSIFDRILDNLQVEIRSFRLRFQPRGRFKTRREGPWTPPSIVVGLRHIKYRSVNEFGSDTDSPEECWRHNDFSVPASVRTLMIYKKASMLFSLGVQQTNDTTIMPLIRDTNVEVQIAFQKRFRDAAILAVQADISLNRVEVQIDHDVLPILIHFLIGMQFCLGKNRSFEDPLRSASASTRKVNTIMETKEQVTVETDMEVSVLGEEDEEDEVTMEDSLEDTVESASDLADDDNKDPSGVETETADAKRTQEASRAQTGVSSVGAVPSKNDRPVLMFPSGVVIHEKLTVSLSVNDCKVRGSYSTNADGYLQSSIKGIIAEALWPKVTGEKGGHLQLSLAYISLQECHGPRVRSIFVAGAQHDGTNNPVENPMGPKVEIPRDENFPLFEDRCIRRDPLDLRHSFPVQAVGMKTTVDFIPKLSDPDVDEIKITIEVGMDRFEIVMDSDSWSRVIRFLANADGGGYDPRWISGDWVSELRLDMLLDPTKPLNLEDHLQFKRQMLLDENELISSDLFNVTARAANISVRVPAALSMDVRSCDILVGVDEIMWVVSSALPRAFLSGKIGLSVFGDDLEGTTKIDFPNDPTDICYAMEQSEDPALRQQGTMTSRKVSTFRSQLTTRGLSVRITPIIPYCNAEQSQQLLAPMEATMLLCFEGEPPETEDSNLIKIAIFLSMQFHILRINLDFDTLTGATSTIMYHSDVGRKTITSIIEVHESVLKALRKRPSPENNQGRLDKSMRGRRVLVRRQLARSRETGGLKFAACIQLAEIHLSVWRQNIPRMSRFRASIVDGGAALVDDTPIPLIQLLHIGLGTIEIGAEGSLQQKQRHVVGKLYLGGFVLEVCDFVAETSKSRGLAVPSVEDDSGQKENDTHEPQMVEIIALGKDSLFVENDKDSPKTPKCILVRIEEKAEETRAVTFSGSLQCNGIFNLHIHDIEMLFLLFVEGLLMPVTAAVGNDDTKDKPDTLFPPGSIGALFESLKPPKPKAPDGTGEVVTKGPQSFLNEQVGIDRYFERLILSRLPQDISQLLFHFETGGLAIIVPHQTSKAVDVEGLPWFALSIHSIKVISSSFTGETGSNKEFRHIIAKSGTTWENLIPNMDEGVSHTLRTSQSLHATENDRPVPTISQTLVPLFEILASYHPSTIDFSLCDSSLSIQDLDNLKEARASLIDFVTRCIVMRHRVESVVIAMAHKNPAEATQAIQPHEVPKENDSIAHDRMVEEARVEYEMSVNRSRAILERLKGLFEARDTQIRSAIVDAQGQVEELKYQVFMKERARLAALALVASQATGWIRAGGVHTFGQRAPTTATLWSYYVVLRKTLLIFFDAPGKPTPLDIVCLHRAVLRPLAGGRKKRDIKNGFALVEKSGKTRFFIASSGPDFEMWIREIQKAIDMYGINEELQEQVDKAFGKSDIAETGDMGTFVDGVGENGDNVTRRQQLRARWSTMTANTRSRVGSAVQAARQRVAKGGGQDGEFGTMSETMDEPSGGTSLVTSEGALEEMEQPEPPTIQSPSYQPLGGGAQPLDTRDSDVTNYGSLIETETNKTSQIGQRFAALRSNAKNRLGSAVQAARDKTKAVADERRRRRQELSQTGTDAADDVSVESAQHRQGFGGLRSRFGAVTAGLKNRKEASEGPENLRIEYAATQVADGMVSIGESPSSELLPEGSTVSSPAESTVPKDTEETHPENEGIRTTRFPADDQYRGQGSTRRLQLPPILTPKSNDAPGKAAQDTEERTSRFKIRGRKSGNQDERTLKSVRVGEGHPSNGLEPHAVPTIDTPLSTVEGRWFVHVRPLIADRKSSDAEKSESEPDNQEAEIEGVADAGEADSTLASPAQVSAEMIDQEEAETTIERMEQAFHIHVVAQGTSSEAKNYDDPIRRTMSEVVALHTSISESITLIPTQSTAQPFEVRQNSTEMEEGLASALGLTPMDVVKLTGHLLGGLLETGSKFQYVVPFWEYQCEVLAQFLNSTLTCPLPASARAALEGFLGLETSGEQRPADKATPPRKNELQLDDAPMREILKLISECYTELLRAESSRTFAKAILGEVAAGTRPPNTRVIQRVIREPFLDPLLPGTVAVGLRQAMHAALLAAMTERDEAQARLIASSVMHVHEMESSRKNVELLMEKLRFADVMIKESYSSNLFGEKKKVAANAEMFQFQEQVIQSTETELRGMCAQLSSEISAKTNANLEVLRLKESRKIEQENEETERKVLEEELKRTRELLRAERTKAQDAREEIERLKASTDTTQN